MAYWRKIKTYNTSSESYLSLIVLCMKNENFAINALPMMSFFLIAFIVTMVTFRRWMCFLRQNFNFFSVGILTLFVYSLICCLIFKHEVLNIYIRIVLWWNIGSVFFSLPFLTSLSVQTSSVENCYRSCFVVSSNIFSCFLPFLYLLCDISSLPPYLPSEPIFISS